MIKIGHQSTPFGKGSSFRCACFAKLQLPISGGIFISCHALLHDASNLRNDHQGLKDIPLTVRRGRGTITLSCRVKFKFATSSCQVHLAFETLTFELNQSSLSGNWKMGLDVIVIIAYICPRSRPVDPNVVCQSVAYVENSDWMTESPSDPVTE